VSSPLPDHVDPWSAADSGTVFSGRLPLSSLPRLREFLVEGAGDVGFRLAFRRDNGGRAVVSGEVHAGLVLRCQRCLQPLAHRIDAGIELALVSGIDEADRISDGYDPLLAVDRLIRPRDLIEDELLLGLPQIPRHEPGACRMQAPDRPSPVQEQPDDRVRPFAVLAAWKRERSH